MKKSKLKNLKEKKLKSYFFTSGAHWNLNLPGSQKHNFHLLEEQAMYTEYEGTLQEEVSPLWSGLSTTFPFYLSFFFIWTNILIRRLYVR